MTALGTDRIRPLLDEPLELAIVDYGMGNRRSVEKALQHLGVRPIVTADHSLLRGAAGLVLPGVGAFPSGMQRLCDLGLDELLREQVAAAKPVLGICLGLQLAFERTSEHGGAEGLAIVPGDVAEMARERGDGSVPAKLPHIGWNEVELRSHSPLLEGLPSRCAFYHVHSFAPRPADDRDVLGTAVYARPFVSVVARGSFYGVQFHPEKSSAAGLRLLANFARLCAPARTGAAL